MTSATELSPAGETPLALIDRVLLRLAETWPHAPAVGTAVVLGPAAGVCGPAAAGPVDAIRVGGSWMFTGGGARAAVQVLFGQQTRCWLLSYTFVPASPLALRPGDGMETVPERAGADTAALCEFMRDRGLGDGWPQLLLLGAPGRLSEGTATALVAFTDAVGAAHLVAPVAES